jgi:hypothetical protein
MRKHTTIDLDMDLVRAAGASLGTARITDTVHAALEAVVQHERRMQFLELEPAIDLADLDAMRAHRFAGTRAPYRRSRPAERRRA